MVAGLLQGVLLAGVIYMYSNGIFSLVNDYYNSEFKKLSRMELKNRQTKNKMSDMERVAEIPAKSLESDSEKCVDPKIKTDKIQIKEDERINISSSVKYFEGTCSADRPPERSSAESGECDVSGALSDAVGSDECVEFDYEDSKQPG